MSTFPGERPDPRRQAETVAALTASLTPVRPLPSDRVMWVIALLFFVVFSVLATAPFGFFGFNRLAFLQKLVYLPALATSALALSAAVVQSMVPGAKRRIGVGVAVFGSFALLCMVVVALFGEYDTARFVLHGIPCLRLGLACSLASAAFSYVLIRKGYAGSPLQMSLAASCFFGLCGVTVLALHCPRLNAPHILVWHLGAIVLSGAAGAAFAYLRSDVALLKAPRHPAHRADRY